MSWGERSCKSPCRAPKRHASFTTCHVDCPHYEWDGTTDPDSKSQKLQNTQNIKNIKLEPTGKDRIKRGAALAMFLMGKRVLPPEKPAKKAKECLNCEVKHTHNNAFCCAGCCREYDKGKEVKK